MRRLKGILIAAGMLTILSGISLQKTPDEKTTTLWEEIPIEEVHTYISQEGKAKDLGLDEPIQEVETGEVKKDAPAAGQVTEFTYEEAQLLMRMAQAEAGNQGIDGMWLVMSVAINRIKSKNFPDNITDVIYQNATTKNGTVIYQFSSVADGRIDEQVVLSNEVHEALAMIECGEIQEKIIAFEVKDSTALDEYFEYVFTFRDHRFYVEKE